MASLETRQDTLRVSIDQDLCTGDGLCAQVSPEVFELDIDGLAYVKGPDGELRTAPGEAVPVPTGCARDVLDAATECPGECIFVTRADGSPA
ncbi:MAG TPA: ferredoxin [Mycobacteriales bacterium]|nr:ferredoxin [Mycobacteriales bacterium]